MTPAAGVDPAHGDYQSFTDFNDPDGNTGCCKKFTASSDSDLTAPQHESDSRADRTSRRELHVHCYRMLASFDEADDAVRTFLRAWQARDTFDGSTLFGHGCADHNACVPGRAPTQRPRPAQRSFADLSWLQPYPDDCWTGSPSDEPGYARDRARDDRAGVSGHAAKCPRASAQLIAGRARWRRATPQRCRPALRRPIGAPARPRDLARASAGASRGLVRAAAERGRTPLARRVHRCPRTL